jgi:hypothetical protein
VGRPGHDLRSLQTANIEETDALRGTDGVARRAVGPVAGATAESDSECVAGDGDELPLHPPMRRVGSRRTGIDPRRPHRCRRHRFGERVRCAAVLLLGAALPLLLGCGQGPHPPAESGFTTTGWSRVQQFEGETFVDGRSLAGDEGLINPVRQNAIVRVRDGAGQLVAESAALDAVTLVRARATGPWSFTARRAYRPLLDALSAAGSVTAPPRPFDPRRAERRDRGQRRAATPTRYAALPASSRSRANSAPRTPARRSTTRSR